LFKFFK
nr:Chain A, Psm alpha-3 [Staphylococcus aureus]6FHD_A Chain A, Psm alpha-3 [Staphylococcus aureus]6FHD_B Chain B, Psm alpha-3 [Staphylococcus aureus]